LHQKAQLLQTKLDVSERERVYIMQIFNDLITSVDKATRMYLKLRKARELDFDLPGEDS
jgi:hypothetical protein